jgi:outer membrane protein, multidrug efflux system
MHQRQLKLDFLVPARARRPRLAARIIGCLLLAPCLASCVVTGYEKPNLNLEVPDKYQYERGHPDTAPPELDWWRDFRSTELTTLIEAAQAQNFDIAVAIAQVEQADALVRISGAALLPNINADFSAQRSQTPASVSQTGTSVTSNLFNANLTASYVLDVWGKNRAALLATEETSIANRFNREVVTLTTVTTVANTYFLVLEAQDRIRIANNNVAAASRILDLVKLQQKIGTLSGLDVAQQEALVATERALIPPLVIAEKQNMEALALLVGRAPEHIKVRGGSLERLKTPKITPGLPSTILTQRPDVRQAEAQLESTNYNVESARAAFFPTIQLTGETGFESLALASLFGPGAWFYTATASLTQPVFDGFLLLGQLDQQIALQKQFLQAYRKSVISAFVNVEQSLIAVQETTRQLRLQSEAVAASRRAFELSETQLRAGTVNLTTVLQIEQTLFTNEDTLAQVRLSVYQAYVSLYQALGGGWPPKDQIEREAVELTVEVQKPIP